MTKMVRKQAGTSLVELISLAGKTALVTGAAAGMGAAIARRFAEAGAHLHLLDVDQAGVEALARELAAAGTTVHAHTVDLANRAAIDRFWHEIAANEPDILVNNAGIFPFCNFLESDEALVQRVMAVNLYAVYWLCQHFVRCRLEHGGGGAIVNISSVEAMLSFKEDLAHYTIGKAGVVALTRALSRDYGRHGIRANVVLPGAINTGGTRRAKREVWRDPNLLRDGFHFQARLSLGRWGNADEVARIVLVLASDLASYMSGAVVPVDGGFLSA
ncbi:MAG: SDR family oxidoreductase [Anaerolineae bacterium]|nr:SDR family oxidoreductase [Anaerolineae bacterium]